MVPTLKDGDHVLVVRTASARPGAIVVVALPDRPLAVKRLVRIEPDGRCWVEGDNEYGSTDSRSLGALPADAIRGVAIGRLWPKPRWLTRRSDYAD